MESRSSRPSRNLTKILKRTKRGYVVYYLDDKRTRRTRDMSLRRFISFLLVLTFLGFIAVQYVLINKFLLHHQLLKPLPARDQHVEGETFTQTKTDFKALNPKSADLHRYFMPKEDETNITNRLTPKNITTQEKAGVPGNFFPSLLLAQNTTKPKDGIISLTSHDTQVNDVPLQTPGNDHISSEPKVVEKEPHKISPLSHGSALRRLDPKSHSAFSSTMQSEGNVQKAQELVFVVVICKGHPDNIMTDVRRQVRQCEVMLKSAVAFTNSILRLIVCTDAIEVYRVLIEVTSMWTAEHRSRVVFERRPVWFPPDRLDLRNIRWPCSAAKLLQTQQLQDFDAVIYLDTDVIFFAPPEELWAEFSQFNSIEMLAMAPEPPSRFAESQGQHQEPRHTPHGLNTGIMLMNLTRMRNFPGRGWTGEVLTAFDTFKTVMSSTPSNRLANAIFSQYPNLVHELGCEWNYVSQLCQGGAISCPQVWKRGVNILHGYGHHFYYDSPKFMAIYQSWRNYELSTPPKQLLDSLETSLATATSGRLWPGCESIRGIDHVFMTAMRRTITRYLVHRLRRVVSEVSESLGHKEVQHFDLKDGVGVV